MYAYSNNGQSMRAWNNPNDLLPGEVYFDHEPTIEELKVAFPNYGVKNIEELIADINAKYQPTLDGILRLITIAIASDGSNQNTKIADSQAKYKEVSDKMNAEIDALYL